MQMAAARRYQARMSRVLQYIDAHLTDELSVEALSEIAAFSRFHFHRQFAALFGIGVHGYVQLGRLKRASYRLAFRMDDPITEIALDCGYAAPESFSRAFRDRVGQTPSAFRRQPHWPQWYTAFQPVSRTGIVSMEQPFRPEQVEIVEVADTPVALLEHRGDPAGIWDSVRRFIAWRRAAGLPPKISATYNIWYDDPDTTPAAAFRLGLCAGTDRAVAPNDAGVVASVIPGGRCARLRSIGSDNALKRAARYLYAEWLPESGEELRDFPPYCQRVTLLPDVPEHELITDIFVPLR